MDNLEKFGITEAVTINGLLDPIERANAMERVENGSAALLYIAPESLRSRTIERLLLGRNVVRFVIDEAHCFSSWGHDFRVDYLYIGDFIKALQEKKKLKEPIPVSCFTATAKPKVFIIHDTARYMPPPQLVIQLTLKDVWLDCFFSCQEQVARLNCGDALIVNEEGDGCLNSAGQTVLKFSKQFLQRMEALKLNQYTFHTARVRFMVYWRKEGSAQEVLVVLPEVYFIRSPLEQQGF